MTNTHRHTHRDLLCSAGDSVMTYMGKESKKRVDICIWITDSLSCTPGANTTLQVNYTPINIFEKVSVM